jgi:hypothetical protein
MESEKFCLRWNDFETNISSAFRYLRDDKDFFDITLVCEDEQIQAHKVILSACSPFFQKILRRNPHQHPLLYMKGVKSSDMVSVLDFMYHGEVNVAQEELNTFLAVAEDLNVKGLTQNQTVRSKIPEAHPSVVSKVCRTIKEHKRQEPPHARPPPTFPMSAEEVEEEVQQVLLVKTEPRDQPLPSSQSTSSYDNTTVQEQPLAMYKEEEEEYEQAGDEQQYTGDISTILADGTGEYFHYHQISQVFCVFNYILYIKLSFTSTSGLFLSHLHKYITWKTRCY